ncbi:hypothetical protein [uncultured Microscilla sp.]|uniref:hypothetical protein n=1 Tax=uncultured Microscilla sp. TaxID=432653 RepID=UPI00260F05E4|nr:hypothetical protein [uncultured Microscilla sp.]
MIKVPPNLKDHLNAAEIRETENWWNQLSNETQSELYQLYKVESGNVTEKKRAEEYGIELIPIAVYGEFVEEENSKRREWVNNDYWQQGFVEYLVNHETYFMGHLPYKEYVRYQKDSIFISPYKETKAYITRTGRPYYSYIYLYISPELVEY